MFHLPSFSLSLEWNLFLLLLRLSIIIPLEIVKVLLWEELKSGISLKALIFFLFFMEANADLFFQNEINCYCKWIVLSCTDTRQGREESARSWVWRSTTTVLWICSAFRECLHSGLTVVLDALPCQDEDSTTAEPLAAFLTWISSPILCHVCWQGCSSACGGLTWSTRVMAGAEEAAALTLWCYKWVPAILLQ